jgi:hypothetical protein
VIGEYPEGRHDEAAVECADGQRRACRRARAFFQQLLHPLELTLVVAEDEGGSSRPDQRTKPFEIAIHSLRREEAELEVHRFALKDQARKRFDAGAPVLGRLEDRVAAGHLLTQPPGDIEVVLRLVPCAGDLIEVGASCLLDEKGVEGEELQEGAADI